MCFPSKRQGDNFSDNVSPNKPTTKAEAPPVPLQSTSAPPPPPASTVPAVVPYETQPETTAPTTATSMPAPRVAIIIYSTWGHIAKLAEAVKKGLEKAGGSANIYQVPETLSDEILKKMYAAKLDYPVISVEELKNFDAYILGVPTRYGTMPAQWKAFWDATGGLWAQGALWGKYATIFSSTAGPGGGQETTALNFMSTLTHHGIIHVPLGYARSFAQLSNLEEVHGGSPWGAGTFSKSDGSRQPTDLELEIAGIHGAAFWENVSKVNFQH
ncbi:flavodoxin-like fold protein [Arthromyces matolae]|nr:flavodoxin-like fold protein [Arthromyces matolae]